MKIKTGLGLLIFCLVTIVSNTRAQSSDSLQQKLNSTTTVESRIPLLKHIGEWYLSKQDTAAIRYFEELVMLSDQSNDPLLKAYAYYRLGVCRYQQNDIKESTAYYFQGLESISPSSEYDESRARLYNGLGWNFGLMGNYENSLKYLRQAERYASLENAQLMGLILNNVGVTYKNLKQYDSALQSFEKSLQLNRKIADTRQVRFNLNNIGSVMIEMKRFKESKVYLQEAMTLNREAQDTVEIVNNLINLSVVSVHEDSKVLSQAQLDEALDMAKRIRSLDQQRRIFFLLTSLSESQHRYEEALGFQREYYKLTDSLYRNESIAKVMEAEAKYISLRKENELQEARERVAEQRFYLSIIVGLLLITFVIIFFLGKMVRAKKANEQELIKLNAEIKKQSEELLLANKAITEANEALEQLVQYRSEVIKNQSKRISHFSFVNSHEIRGPLATLMGLLGLLYEEKSPEKREQILGFLKITSTKLDKVIDRVSQELEKED